MLNSNQIESWGRQALRALLFYALFLLVAIPVSIGVSLFTLLYSIAMLGPWLAGKVSLRGRFRRAIDVVFGIEPIHQFRDDIKTLVGKHAQLELGDRSASEIRRNIYENHEAASAQAERGEFLIAIITGVISLVVGTLTGTPIIGWLLGTYSVMMTLTIGLHVVVLDILAYNRSDDLSPYRREHLVLLEGWNRAILNDHGTQASVLAVGILYKISPLGYEIAKELLDEMMEEDLGKWEQVLFIAGAAATIIDELIREGVN